ncbi:hypothetical protein ACOY5L_23810, partial [Escherichia coli]
VSIKNDGHYFCRAGGNRPDGLNEPVTPKQTTTINKDSVLQAARQAYAREYDEETTETADFGSYEVKGNKVEFEVFNPEDRAYDKVTVTVGADGNATGASVEFIGK